MVYSCRGKNSGGNFKNDPQRAARAGEKGGRSSSKKTDDEATALTAGVYRRNRGLFIIGFFTAAAPPFFASTGATRCPCWRKRGAQQQ
jgi:hypothetical protein